MRLEYHKDGSANLKNTSRHIKFYLLLKIETDAAQPESKNSSKQNESKRVAMRRIVLIVKIVYNDPGCTYLSHG